MSTSTSTWLRHTLLAALALVAAPALAAEVPAGAPESAAGKAEPVAKAEEEGRIKDNLFLLEEAYNQEPGVIQHISVFQYSPSAGAWSYGFTEEVPVPNDTHQLSLGLLFSGETTDGSGGLGDLMLNYRYQMVGAGGKGPVAVAPRLSLVLPTGSVERGSRGSLGVQFNLPVSIELGELFALHLNLGATLTPGAKSVAGRSQPTVDTNAGFALVFQPLSWFNAFVEVSHTWVEELLTNQGRERVHALTISPAVRFAIDHAGTGLQVVPGIAVPIQVVGEVEAGVVGYLSFEHAAF